MESTESSHMFSTCNRPTPNSPTINILLQSGTFVTTDEPTLTCYHPKPVVYLGFTLGVVHSVGFGIHIMGMYFNNKNRFGC